MARCGAPLLFCFQDKELPPFLTTRVGRGKHKGGRAHFCHRIPLTLGGHFFFMNIYLFFHKYIFLFLVINMIHYLLLTLLLSLLCVPLKDFRPDFSRWRQNVCIIIAPTFVLATYTDVYMLRKTYIRTLDTIINVYLYLNH